MHKLFFSSPFTFLTQQLCAFKDDQVPQIFNLDGHRHTPSNRNTGQSGQDAQVLCKLLTVAVPRGCPKHRENKRMAHTCWIVSFTKTASLQKTKYFRRESMCFYSRGNHFSLLVICTIKKEEGVVGVVLHLKKMTGHIWSSWAGCVLCKGKVFEWMGLSDCAVARLHFWKAVIF